MQPSEALSSANEHELHNAIANSGMALIWMSGLDKGCYYFNKRWLEFTGRTLEQELGNGWAEGVHPDDFQKCLDIYVDSFDAREKFSMEYRLRYNDGEYRWILDDGTPAYDSGGNFSGYIGHCLDITEKKNLEIQLKKQLEVEMFNSLVLSSIGEGVYGVDSRGSCTYVNNTALQMLGFSHDEVLGLNTHELFHHSDKNGNIHHKSDCPLYLTLSDGATREATSVFIKKSGEYFDVYLKITPLIESGKIIGAVIIFQDITLRNIQQQQLLFEKTKAENITKELEAFYNNAPIGISLVNVADSSDRVLLRVNRHYEFMFGYETGELVGKSPRMVFKSQEDFEEAGRKVLSQLASGKSSGSFESELVRKDGTVFLGRAIVSVIDESGSNKMITLVQDITDERNAQEALRDAEYRLRTIIDMEPECVKIINEDGLLEYMNPAGLGMIEADSLKLVKGALVVNILAPEYRMAYAKLHKKVISGERMTMQYEVLGLKGGRRWLETHAVPMKVGDKTMHLAVTRDISEHKKMEDKLKATNEHLQELVEEETAKRLEKERLLIQQSKMAMMGEMIGAIAHQWRQPLNALGITIQDMEYVYRHGEINDEYMSEFKSDSMSIIQRMSQTIDDFRRFFRPNKEKQEFALESAVTDTLRIVHAQLANHFIAVNFNKVDEHRLFGYKSELEQVILIVISNAKDALVDNKIQNPKIDILTHTDESTGLVSLIIGDNAGGIPNDIIDRVFEPYFTTKEQGKGTGIGLYMAKEIVERQMGGKLSVLNVDGGARFIIEL